MGSSPTGSKLSEDARYELDRRIGPLASAFSAQGHRFFLVGGLVRDALLGRGLTGDIDITTDALPNQIAQLLAPWADTVWDQGKNFGTMGARCGSTTVEITTHRAESYERESRKPSVRFGADITIDLGRRDFTVNAMAVEMPGWALIDPFGGMEDLANGVLRTPAEPQGLFSDDPLRMIRAARFCSQLDLVPEPELVAAIRSMRPRLAIVSRERIATELTKLLAMQSCAAGIALLAETGLLGDLVPPWRDRSAEVPAAALDRLSGIAGEFGEPGDPSDLVATRWAILLGPVCRDDAEAAGYLSALRIKGNTIRAARAVLRAAQAAESTSDAAGAQRADATRWRPFMRRLIADHNAHLDAAAVALRAWDRPLAAEFEAQLTQLRAAEGEALQRPPLDGHGVMEVLGTTGTAIGEALAWLREQQVLGGPLSPERARALLAQWDRARHR